MKSLSTIQTLSRVGQIISKVIYICCIVGFCACLAGIAAMLLGGHSLKLGGVTLHSFLQSQAGVSTGTIWAAIAAGLLLCAGEYAVAKLACRYFTHELAAGTPFTLTGARELLHLGISCIWIPLLAMVLARVAQEILSQFMTGVDPLEPGGADNVSLGVMFIVMSLLCRCGAEQQQTALPEQEDAAE